MDNGDGDGGVRTIRTAVVGYGLSGRVFHAPLVASDAHFHLAAIVTGSSDRQAFARGDHPTTRIYSTYRELWANEHDLDLVILSTPPDTHVDFAEQALRAGAAVVIDKPFVPRRSDALSLVTASAAAGRPVMVFHNRRWDGDFLTIRGLVESGELGEVFAFESTFEHWAPEATSGWKDQLPLADAGGVAYDLGSHLVDQALVLFGPAALTHSTLRTVRRGGGNDDHSQIELIHESGVESRLLMSRVSRALGPRFRVLGTKGSYLSEGLDGQEPALAAGVSPHDPNYGVTPAVSYGVLEVEGAAGIVRRRVPTERGDYPEFYRRAARAIRGEGPEPVSLDEAIAVVDLLELAAAQNAAKSHGTP